MVKHTQRQVPRGLDQRFDQRGERGVVTRLRSIDQAQALLPMTVQLIYSGRAVDI